MFKKLNNFIHIIQNLYFKEKIFLKRKTYSMNQEDVYINKFFENKKNGYFVDVGCFHPMRINNTYLLYKKGWRGINIDISQFSIDLFNYLRPKDVNILCGISDKNGNQKVYYQKEFSVLSTLKKKSAEAHFQGKIKTKTLKCLRLHEVIKNTKFKNRPIDFLNIDIEGFDEIVLNSFEFDMYQPRLICAEDESPNKKFNETNLFKILKPKGYEHLWSGIFSHLFYLNK